MEVPCKACGANNDVAFKFCTSCGSKLDKPEGVTETVMDLGNGRSVVKVRIRKKRRKKKSNNGLVYFLIVSLSLAVIMIIYGIFSGELAMNNQPMQSGGGGGNNSGGQGSTPPPTIILVPQK